MKDFLRILHKSVMEGSLCAKGEKEKTPAIVWGNTRRCLEKQWPLFFTLNKTPRKAP